MDLQLIVVFVNELWFAQIQEWILSIELGKLGCMNFLLCVSNQFTDTYIILTQIDITTAYDNTSNWTPTSILKIHFDATREKYPYHTKGDFTLISVAGDPTKNAVNGVYRTNAHWPLEKGCAANRKNHWALYNLFSFARASEIALGRIIRIHVFMYIYKSNTAQFWFNIFIFHKLNAIYTLT